MNEQFIPFADLPNSNLLPPRRAGKKIHPSTLYRWSHRGLRGVKLRFVKIGGQPCTTAEWLVEFFMASAGANSTLPPPPNISKRQLKDVDEALDRLGI